MSDFKVRVNTLKFAFGQGSLEPSDTEMFDFCRDWQMSSEQIYSIHRDSQAKAIFIKFKDEKVLLAVKETLQTVMNFKYRNGSSTNVVMSDADESYKYVRIFNLPPEIEDKDLHQVLSSFGVVRHLVRERYHQDTGFPVYSTVRGAHMEVSKELPAQIRVKHFQARVFYDDLVNKCFICKSSEHIKVNCPRKTTKSAVEGGKSYSAVLVANNNMEEDHQALEPETPLKQIEESNLLSPIIKDHRYLLRTKQRSHPPKLPAPLPEESPKVKSPLPKQKEKDHQSRADQLRNKDRIEEGVEKTKVSGVTSLLLAQSLRTRSRSARKENSVKNKGRGRGRKSSQPEELPADDALANLFGSSEETEEVFP